MAVVHLKKTSKIICNTKQKKNPIISTTNRKEVTCKKCIKSIKNKTFGIKYIFDKKHNHCLKLDIVTSLKLGNDFEDEISIMMVLTPKGMFSTTMKFISKGLRKAISVKTINYLRNYFEKKKKKLNRTILVKDVIDDFEF